MPKGAKILSGQEQCGDTRLWALGNCGKITGVRNFRIVGTGQPIEESPNTMDYIGTFQRDGDNFIGHVFEIISFG